MREHLRRMGEFAAEAGAELAEREWDAGVSLWRYVQFCALCAAGQAAVRWLRVHDDDGGGGKRVPPSQVQQQAQQVSTDWN